MSGAGAPNTVGFVGLGRMGRPMVAHLPAAGFDVVVHDLDAASTARVADDIGAKAAATPADLAGVEVLVTMLPTGADVAEAVRGIAPSLATGAVVVDMSSSEPTGTRELGATLASHGVGLVDAPVSGGVPKAVDGTLSIMLGADDPELATRAEPVVAAMSARIFRTGPLGSGHACKALNNYVAAAGFTAAAEAADAGRRFGLDPEVLVDVLNASTGRNFSTEYTFVHHVLTGTFGTGFALGLMTKDVRIAAALATELGVDAPVCEAVLARLADAVDGLGPAVDHSAAVTHWSR
jgi:3-hydroxyisobutyrate dehydrogenase